jgi:hypothetical protein
VITPLRVTSPSIPAEEPSFPATEEPSIPVKDPSLSTERDDRIEKPVEIKINDSSIPSKVDILLAKDLEIKSKKISIEDEMVAFAEELKAKSIADALPDISNTAGETTIAELNVQLSKEESNLLDEGKEEKEGDKVVEITVIEIKVETPDDFVSEFVYSPRSPFKITSAGSTSVESLPVISRTTALKKSMSYHLGGGACGIEKEQLQGEGYGQHVGKYLTD